MASNPEVSVVIPTRDSAAHLRRCLASLAHDQGASFEVIVVDQKSADGTRDVALERGTTLLDTQRPGLYAPPTHSRNLGAAAARGEYLLHLDADMSLPPAMLGSAVRLCREGDHVALTLEEMDVTNGFWADCKALERRAYRGSRVLEAARFVRADVFQKLGGYDESLGSGEDWDIHARFSTQGSIGRLEGAVYHNLGELSLAAQIRKKFAYGKSAAEFLSKHKKSEFSRAMASAFWRSRRVLVRQPFHALGLAILRCGEVVALAAGIAAANLERRNRRQ